MDYKEKYKKYKIKYIILKKKLENKYGGKKADFSKLFSSVSKAASKISKDPKLRQFAKEGLTHAAIGLAQGQSLEDIGRNTAGRAVNQAVGSTAFGKVINNPNFNFFFTAN